MAETEPLLPSTTPRKKLLPSTPPSSTLCRLPEDGEISISISFANFPASPSLKERLIFGSSSSDLPSSISPEALSLNARTPSSPIAPAGRIPVVTKSPVTAAEGPTSPSWLTNPPAAAQGRSNLQRSRIAPAMSAINAHAAHLRCSLSAPPNPPPATLFKKKKNHLLPVHLLIVHSHPPGTPLSSHYCHQAKLSTMPTSMRHPFIAGMEM